MRIGSCRAQCGGRRGACRQWGSAHTCYDHKHAGHMVPLRPSVHTRHIRGGREPHSHILVSSSVRNCYEQAHLMPNDTGKTPIAPQRWPQLSSNSRHLPLGSQATLPCLCKTGCWREELFARSQRQLKFGGCLPAVPRMQQRLQRGRQRPRGERA